MLNETDSHCLMNQLAHQADIRHQEMLSNIIDEGEMKIFSILQPRLFQDGNKWCVLYGENIQTGVCGFGDTRRDAIRAWNNAWNDLPDQR